MVEKNNDSERPLSLMVHKESYFDKEGVSVSVQQELVYLYTRLYSLRFETTFSQASEYQDVLILPRIVYGKILIDRSQIFQFLQKLTKREIQGARDDLTLMYLHKYLLTDLQFLLTYYILESNRGSVFFKFLYLLLRPLHVIRRYFRLKRLRRDLCGFLCVTSKGETIDRIRFIFNKAERFLETLRNQYDLADPVLILINAAFLSTRRVLKQKVAFIHIGHRRL